MAVQIVGKPEDVKRYRKVLHDRGMNTKRAGGHAVYKDKPAEFRLCQGTFKMVNAKRKVKEENDNDDEETGGQGEEGTTGESAYDPKRKLTIVGMANANIVDRMDERVDPKGGDFTNFQKNPVLLSDHMYWASSVIGAVEELTPEDAGTGFTAIIGDPTKAPLTTAQEEVRSLVAQGFIKTVSIGFIPQKIQAPTFNDEGAMIDPAVILKWELLELSVVAVPANPDATFEMKQFVESKIALNTTETKKFNGLTKLLANRKNGDSSKNKTVGKPSGQTKKKGLDSMDEEQTAELLEGIKAIGEGIAILAEGQASANEMLTNLSKGTGEPDDEEEEDEKGEDEEDEEEEDEDKEGEDEGEEEDEEEDEDEKEGIRLTITKLVEDVTKLSALVIRLYDHCELSAKEEEEEEEEDSE